MEKESEDIDALIYANNITDRKRRVLSEVQSSKLMQIIGELELQKGTPPTWHEIRKNMHENNYIEFQNMTGMTFLQHIFSILYARGAIVWEDKVFIDRSWNYFSLKKYNSTFHRYSERFEKNYSAGGYIVDDMKLIRPGPNTKTIDFGELWDVLRSSDESLLTNAKWMFEDRKDDKFLNHLS